MLEIRRQCAGRSKPVVFQVTDRPPAKKSPVICYTLNFCDVAHHAMKTGLGTCCCSVSARFPVAAERIPVQGVSFSNDTGKSVLAEIQTDQGAAEGNMLETFGTLSAFFVRFDGDPEPDFVRKWAVQTLLLSKNTRHGDRSCVERFWAALEASPRLRNVIG